MHVGAMLIAGQRMADQDRIRLVGVQRAIRLIGKRERTKNLPAFELQSRIVKRLGVTGWRVGLIDRYTIDGLEPG